MIENYSFGNRTDFSNFVLFSVNIGRNFGIQFNKFSSAKLRR
jgi:hypothetical protein